MAKSFKLEKSTTETQRHRGTHSEFFPGVMSDSINNHSIRILCASVSLWWISKKGAGFHRRLRSAPRSDALLIAGTALQSGMIVAGITAVSRFVPTLVSRAAA